jgi:hypothetical protein
MAGMAMGMGTACLAVSMAAMLLACATKPGLRVPPPAPWAAPTLIPGQQFVPACKLEGCCEGHGAVAYVQPDKFVMCTDGSPSQICDCH